MKKIILPILMVFFALPASLFGEEDKKKDGVWYRVNDENDLNSIYVNYKSIKRKGDEVGYEQMEFLLEKQKLEGTDKEYKFIVSKRTGDCENKKYLVNEEKYYDVQVNKEKDEIIDELVFKYKYEGETVKGWEVVIPNTLIEKVWRFTCLYKPEDN